jgi:YggT family protein
VGNFVITFLQILVTILNFAIFGRALISWFPVSPENPLVRVLNEITEPILAPLRRVIPRVGMIDITPMVAIIILYIVGNQLGSLGS